jgi:hypothetical protein
MLLACTVIDEVYLHVSCLLPFNWRHVPQHVVAFTLQFETGHPWRQRIPLLVSE